MAQIFTGFFMSLVGICIAGAAFWAGSDIPNPAIGAFLIMGGLGLAMLGAKLVDMAGE